MNILSIDCSNGLMLSLRANEKEFCYQKFEQKKQSDDLLSQIDKLLKDAKIDIKNIDVFAVGVGPGSFTGIRVAISTVKGLAIGTGAKILTFNSFESMDNLPDNNYGVIVEGFGNNYYYHYKKFGRVFEGCSVPEKISVFAEGVPTYTLSQDVASKFANFDIKIAKYDPKKAVDNKIGSNQFILTNQIEPIYLRASQAEIERKKHEN